MYEVKNFQFIFQHQPSKTALKMHSKMNQDLGIERAKINFNIEEFTNFYYGSAENVAKKKFLGILKNFKHRIIAN
jgi:hypothetical protein